MIDEEELAELLQELGDSFEVSNEAQAAILETATPEPRKRPNKSTPSRSRVPSTRKGKGVLVAAALLMVLAGGITFAVASPNSSVHQASGPSAASAKSPFLSRASGGAAGGSGGAYGVGSNHRGIVGHPCWCPQDYCEPPGSAQGRAVREGRRERNRRPDSQEGLIASGYCRPD